MDDETMDEKDRNLVCARCGERWNVADVLCKNAGGFKRAGALIKVCPRCPAEEPEHDRERKAYLDEVRAISRTCGEDIDLAVEILASIEPSEQSRSRFREVGGLSNLRPHFPLGQTLATPGALAALTCDDIGRALARHMSCDWGDCCPEDKAENEFSLRRGFRLFSVYHSQTGVKFWVITEANRSATTVLLPEEY